MHRLFVIFLSFVYLVLSTGFTQYAHFCKSGNVKQVSHTNLAEDPDKPCRLCSAKEKGLKDKKKNCCLHDSKIIKVDDSVQKQSFTDVSVKFLGEAIPNRMLGTLFDTATAATTTPENYSCSSKIPIQGNPLYILHCVYTI